MTIRSDRRKFQESLITLDIGGMLFVTARETLKAVPASVLAAVATEPSPYFFDRDGTHFRYILNYLRVKCDPRLFTIPEDKQARLELIAEAEYYGLNGLVTILQPDDEPKIMMLSSTSTTTTSSSSSSAAAPKPRSKRRKVGDLGKSDGDNVQSETRRTFFVRAEHINATFTVPFDESFTVGDVKRYLQTRTGFPTSRIQLSYGGLTNCYNDDPQLIRKIIMPNITMNLTLYPIGDVIFVRTLTGKTVSIPFDDFTTLGKAKQVLKEKEGIPTDQVRLIYQGMQLEDDKGYLKDLNIKADATLHAVLKLRGD